MVWCGVHTGERCMVRSADCKRGLNCCLVLAAQPDHGIFRWNINVGDIVYIYVYVYVIH